ncbi:hypothetical protein CsSME_00048290 [Camellia sinensis var. sinensis]
MLCCNVQTTSTAIEFMKWLIMAIYVNSPECRWASLEADEDIVGKAVIGNTIWLWHFRWTLLNSH